MQNTSRESANPIHSYQYNLEQGESGYSYHPLYVKVMGDHHEILKDQKVMMGALLSGATNSLLTLLSVSFALVINKVFFQLQVHPLLMGLALYFMISSSLRLFNISLFVFFKKGLFSHAVNLEKKSNPKMFLVDEKDSSSGEVYISGVEDEVVVFFTRFLSLTLGTILITIPSIFMSVIIDGGAFDFSFFASLVICTGISFWYTHFLYKAYLRSYLNLLVKEEILLSKNNELIQACEETIGKTGHLGFKGEFANIIFEHYGPSQKESA